MAGKRHAGGSHRLERLCPRIEGVKPSAASGISRTEKTGKGTSRTTSDGCRLSDPRMDGAADGTIRDLYLGWTLTRVSRMTVGVCHVQVQS